MDGKHVNITKPSKSGSQFFNYKGTFSMVLLALVNPEYKFILVDIGAYGSQSDRGVLRMSSMGKLLHKRALGLPDGKRLTGFEEVGPIPYFIAADEAFPLQVDIMHPFSGRERKRKEAVRNMAQEELDTAARKKTPRDLTDRQLIFNYRVLRGRHIVENVFSICVHHWRVLLHAMALHKPENVETVIMACVVLHNYLCKEIVSYESIMAKLDTAH